MRGTGSNDVRIEHVFIPSRWCWRIAPLTVTDPAFEGPLYRLGLWLVGPMNASIALGIARAALDDLIELAGRKVPTAIREDRRFQQYFRDVHTVRQHAFSSWNRYESVGKLMLGRESDWGFTIFE